MGRTDEDLKRKLILLMTFRMVIIITLLGAAILIQLVSRTILPINPLYFLIFLTSFFTLVYALIFTKIKRLELLAFLQLSGDVLVITLLIYFTGGVKSPFSFLYILIIITSSILLYRRGSLLIASISGIAYGALVDLNYYSVLPYYDLEPAEIAQITNKFIYYYIFIHIFGFYTTALLSSYLSERLRRTRTELQEIDEDYSDLKLLQEKIIDSMSAGLIFTDLNGQINFINEAGLHILGSGSHQVLGKHLQKLFIEEIDLAQIRETLLEDHLCRVERSFVKSEDLYLVGMNLSYVYKQEGEPSGIIVIFQDITESRRLELQFRLQERMVALGTMAAGIAHEIRNPLAAIHGSVQMLKDDLQLSVDQRKLMEIVLTESLRLDRTIQNFLNYAKPKQLLKQRRDLKSLIEDMLTFIKQSPDFKKGHSISFSASSEDFLHDVDPDQMKQVIWNISDNALRAMPNGGTLNVSLEHDLQGSVLLTFHDEGKGITKERLNSIFDPFQISTTGGSGLGMAIVYRIVQDHNGKIFIESKEGSGTTVSILLPATQVVQPLLQ